MVEAGDGVAQRGRGLAGEIAPCVGRGGRQPSARYSQWVIVPSPVTDEVTRSFWLPAFAAAGLSGLAGLVRKLPLTTSVVQVLSL